MIEKIFELIFALRPLIDLLWDTDILLGMNFAGVIAMVTVILAVIGILSRGKIILDRVSVFGILFTLYNLLICFCFAENLSDYDYTARLASSICVYMILSGKLTEKSFEKMTSLFIIITLVPIIITFMQAFGLADYTYWDYINGQIISRGSGGYRHPSVLTRFCVFGLLYVLYFLDTRWKNHSKRFFAYIYIFLCLAAVILSYHRTGYLLVVLMLLVWFALKYKSKLLKYISRILLMAVVIGIVFNVLNAMHVITIDTSGFKRLLSTENIIRQVNGENVLVMRGRGNLINLLIQGFCINPWYNTLFGNGVNVNPTTHINMQVADVDFVRVLWNSGIVGFIIYVCLIVALCTNIRIANKTLKSNALYRLAICVFVTFLIWGLTLEISASPNAMYHVYVVIGFVYYEGKRRITVPTENHRDI